MGAGAPGSGVGVKGRGEASGGDGLGLQVGTVGTKETYKNRPIREEGPETRAFCIEDRKKLLTI